MPISIFGCRLSSGQPAGTPFWAMLALALCFSAAAQADEYNLTIAEQPVTIDGTSTDRLTINGQLPGPTLRFHEGEDVVINVKNALEDNSASFHWHGLILPGEMDGVPGFNGFKDIPAGETFTYRFTAKQSGTYWYHSHSGTQEQAGLYGSIIIDPAKPDPYKADRDYVVVLSDFTRENTDSILKNLKVNPSYYNYRQRTLGDYFEDVSSKGFKNATQDRLDWGDMRMDPTDLADVSGYTFLINGKSPDMNWTGMFKPGERVRLRFINASSMSFYDVRIPGLKMIVVAADGRNVQPLPVDEFRISVAETYDVLVTPAKDEAYTIMAEPIDRTGYAAATLAPREGMKGEIPPLRPRTILTMDDMSMAGMGGIDMSHMDMSGMGDMKGMDHSNMAGMEGMDMKDMDMSGMDMSGMHHMGKKDDQVADDPDHPKGWANASTPKGMKALDYKDLRSLALQPDTREPDRDIQVTLGGNMERYIWTINGQTTEDAKPIDLNQGERVRIKFTNETMMAHPMHLHGMFVQLENGQPAARMPDKHTVIVPPGKSVSVLLTASEPGEWAFHCHLLYHMSAGMMTKVVVARLADGGQK